MSTADRGSNALRPVRSPGRSEAFSHDQQFERIVTTLQEAALNDSAWSRALALIDDACAMHSSHLAVVAAGPGAPADTGVPASTGVPEYLFGTWRGHGVSLDALAHEYVERYFSTDARVARLLLLPVGSLMHNDDLFTEDERSTSATYNQFLLRWGIENQLSVRLEALDGLHILWTVSRSRAQGEWRPWQLGVLTRLLPHVGGAVRVRQALAKADARAAALAALLDEPPLSVMLLDRHGQVVQTNAHAAELLAEERLLCERDGMLRAMSAAENERLGGLLAQALPKHGGTPRSGVMDLGEGVELQLRLQPVAIARMDFGARRVAAVALAAKRRI